MGVATAFVWRGAADSRPSGRSVFRHSPEQAFEHVLLLIIIIIVIDVDGRCAAR
jgi:hypothetical protein